jgi:hypothetical protein
VHARRTRLALLLLAAETAILGAIIAAVVWAGSAPAHVPNTPCARVARLTGTTAERCRAARIRHAANHRAAKLAVDCRRATRMPRQLCAALGPAIVRDHRPASSPTSDALATLLWRESSYNPNAVNRRSRACGWFQRLTRRGCPWPITPRAGGRWIVHHPPVEQARNGLSYIADRYGTPAAALRHHNGTGWY